MLVGVELFLCNRRLGLGEKQVKIVSNPSSWVAMAGRRLPGVGAYRETYLPNKAIRLTWQNP